MAFWSKSKFSQTYFDSWHMLQKISQFNGVSDPRNGQNLKAVWVYYR